MMIPFKSPSFFSHTWVISAFDGLDDSVLWKCTVCGREMTMMNPPIQPDIKPFVTENLRHIIDQIATTIATTKTVSFTNEDLKDDRTCEEIMMEKAIG